MTAEMDYARVGTLLTQRIREMRLSNAELARRTRVDRSRIAMILKGEPWSMRPDVVARIESGLGLKVGAIGAIGAGKSLRSVMLPDDAPTDTERRLAELERAYEEQREMLEELVDRLRDDARSGRGARR